MTPKKNKQKSIRWMLTRTFRFIFPMRIILGLFVFYQYLIFVSDTEASKWGTVVEGVFEPLSYLPYWSNSSNDRFYQRLLFNSCITAIHSGTQLSHDEQACDISTKDNQVYTITIKTGYVRSDQKNLSVDDVFFTYNKVLKNNIRQLPALDIYASLDVTQPTRDSVKVIFPFASYDNILFFTNFILPGHILENYSLEDYTSTFAAAPTTSSCSSIEQEGQTDSTSLVFNLNECYDSYLSYYQIKNFEGFSGFSDYVKNNSDNIVDIYVHETQLPGYNKYRTRTNRYATLFFNKESKRLSKRINRSLGGLINSNFFTGDYTVQDYIEKDQIIFDTFLSEGSNIGEYISTHNPRLEIEKKDLQMIDIKALPEQISFKKQNEKLIYYIDRLTEKTHALDINFDIKDIVVRQARVQYGDNKDKKAIKYKDNQTYTYILATGADYTGTKHNPDGLREGLNKFTVRGNVTDEKTKKTTQQEIGSIDIYYLEIPERKEESTEIDADKKIKIIYLKDPEGSFIAKRLETIFANKDIAKYFSFIGYDAIDEFETKITSKDYDIVIRPLDVGLKKDIGNIFLTDTASINPSLYTNGQFAAYISEYRNSKDPRVQQGIKDSISAIYGTDMPFIILGSIVQPVYIKDSVNFGDKGPQKDVLYDINGFKQEVLRNVQLVKHIRPNLRKLLSREERNRFFQKHLNMETEEARQED